MKVQEIVTPLPPEQVLEGARNFFMLSGTPYAASPEKSGDGFVKLHLEVGEIVIATLPHPDGTLVRGSASRGGQLLSRYLTLLASLRGTHELAQTGTDAQLVA